MENIQTVPQAIVAIVGICALAFVVWQAFKHM